MEMEIEENDEEENDATPPASYAGATRKFAPVVIKGTKKMGGYPP